MMGHPANILIMELRDLQTIPVFSKNKIMLNVVFYFDHKVSPLVQNSTIHGNSVCISSEVCPHKTSLYSTERECANRSCPYLQRIMHSYKISCTFLALSTVLTLFQVGCFIQFAFVFTRFNVVFCVYTFFVCTCFVQSFQNIQVFLMLALLSAISVLLVRHKDNIQQIRHKASKSWTKLILQ